MTDPTDPFLLDTAPEHLSGDVPIRQYQPARDPLAGKENLMKIPKNWRTSLGGLASILYVLAGAAKALLDGDPLTVPDWNTILPVLGVGGALMKAKDHNVTGGTIQQ